MIRFRAPMLLAVAGLIVATASTPGQAPPASRAGGLNPLVGSKIKGKVGNTDIDLTITPFVIGQLTPMPAQVHGDPARLERIRTAKMPDGWTSADAAGLPIFPATVRYDEIKRGMVEHAMRVGVNKTRRAYVSPATHYASKDTDENLPRMGERIRLKKDYDISGFSPAAQAILKGLKKYGIFVADNGLDWTISVTPDSRIPLLHEEFARIKGSAFEVVERNP